MKIAIVGTGYVGLVTGTCLADTGNEVVCVDIDKEKLSKLKQGKVTIYEPGLETIFHRNLDRRRLTFTDDLRKATLASEIVFLCLPTPQEKDGSADLKYIMEVAESLGKIFSSSGEDSYKIIVNKSTVPVGTVNKIAAILRAHGAANWEVISNPEFLREGYAVEDFMKPDRIVVGSSSEKALERMKLLYEPYVRQGNPIITMDITSAEVTKYAANSYLALRITYMNELANFCEKVGADVDQVRLGMSTDSRIGKRFLFPGIGFGGSCLPKDVKALINTSRQHSAEISLLTLVDTINRVQKLALVKKMKTHFGGSIQGKNFAVWGLAFKPNTDDARDSPAIALIKEMLQLGALVAAHDPAALETAKFYLNNDVSYLPDQYDALRNADALVIATEWNEFRNPDFKKMKLLLRQAVIFDGRNIFRPELMQKLGFVYYSMGRQMVT